MVNEKGIDIMDNEEIKKILSDVMGYLDYLCTGDQLVINAGLYASIGKHAYEITDEDTKGQMKEFFIDQLAQMKQLILSEE